MADRRLIGVLQRILTASRDQAGVGDAELLRRYTSAGDQAAFELLIWRYQRMVLGVCRRVLQDLHDAEEAFQATFLILARKARTVGRTGTVGGWLHRVATRVSLAARKARARRTERERPLTDQAADGSDSVAALESQELGRVVDEEVSRLPERFREAVVLCYFEGRTVDEAAARLGCPRGTVASRLARARARLEVRLTRRGLALSSGALAAGLSAGGSAVAAAGELVRRTGQVAASGGAAISTRIVALSEEVIRAMVMRKVLTGAAVLVVSVMMLGGGLVIGLNWNAGDNAALAGGAPTNDSEQRSVVVTVSRPTKRELAPSEDFTGSTQTVPDDIWDEKTGKVVRVTMVGAYFLMDERSYLNYMRMRQAGNVKDHEQVAVGLLDENDFPRAATITKFGDEITREGLRVSCKFTKEDRLLLPGMFVRVRMKVGPPRPVLEVPEEALTVEKGETFVWVMDDRNAVVERRSVKKGQPDGNMVVIDNGLRPEDRVVIAGAKGLKVGQRVEVRTAEPKPAEKK
jgi:RNA polymerase sigma factor (sigma-70 family)